jgi:hypothetical protein
MTTTISYTPSSTVLHHTHTHTHKHSKPPPTPGNAWQKAVPGQNILFFYFKRLQTPMIAHTHHSLSLHAPTHTTLCFHMKCNNCVSTCIASGKPRGPRCTLCAIASQQLHAHTQCRNEHKHIMGPKAHSVEYDTRPYFRTLRVKKDSPFRGGFWHVGPISDVM